MLYKQININQIHPILLVLSNEGRYRSSIYTANKDRDNIPPCRSPLLVLKYYDISVPYPINTACLYA